MQADVEQRQIDDARDAQRLLELSPVAQEFSAPPFRALDRMQADVEQRQIDDARNAQRLRELSPGAPAPGTAARALEDAALDREIDRLRLDGDLQRAQRERMQVKDEAELPNRRIAAASVLRIQNPAEAGLPQPAPGRFYARLEGRTVVVDERSELVVEVLPKGE
jgi:hypothetical protein